MSSDNTGPEFLTVHETAKLLRMTERAVTRLLNDGKLPGIYGGTREGWRVRRSDLSTWTTNQPKESTMTHRELVELQAEAVRRLPLNTQWWWKVEGVQDDHFNLSGAGTGLPRPIHNRAELDFYMPNR